jgi:hypothetical protein
VRGLVWVLLFSTGIALPVGAVLHVGFLSRRQNRRH